MHSGVSHDADELRWPVTVDLVGRDVKRASEPSVGLRPTQHRKAIRDLQRNRERTMSPLDLNTLSHRKRKDRLGRST